MRLGMKSDSSVFHIKCLKIYKEVKSHIHKRRKILLYMRVCVYYMYTCTWVYRCVCVCTHVYACVYIFEQVHMCMCICVCTCVYACVHMYACICICVHTYTHRYRCQRGMAESRDVSIFVPPESCCVKAPYKGLYGEVVPRGCGQEIFHWLVMCVVI